MSEIGEGEVRQATTSDLFRFVNSVEAILNEADSHYFQTMRFSVDEGDITFSSLEGPFHKPRDLVAVRADGESILELAFENDVLQSSYFPPDTDDTDKLIGAIVEIIDGVKRSEEHELTDYESALFEGIAHIGGLLVRGDNEPAAEICEEVANGTRRTMQERRTAMVCTTEESRMLDDHLLLTVRTMHDTDGDEVVSYDGWLPYMQFEVSDCTDAINEVPGATDKVVELMSMWQDGGMEYFKDYKSELEDLRVIRKFEDTAIPTVDASDLDRVGTILMCWLQSKYPNSIPIFYAPRN